MKTYTFFIALAVSSLLYSFTTPGASPAPSIECSAKIVKRLPDNDIAHIEVTVNGENEEVYYSLKRQFEDGRLESVQSIKITPNSDVSSAVSLCQFADNNVPHEDFSYVLMRINPTTKAFNVVQRWNYSAVTQSISSPDFMFASND